MKLLNLIIVVILSMSSVAYAEDDYVRFNRTQIEQEDLLKVLLEAPSPGIATGLATSVGFGSGHFYAKQPVAGSIILGTEVVTLGSLLWMTSRLQCYNYSYGNCYTAPSTELIMVGASVSVLTRLIEISTAGVFARKTRSQMIKERGTTPTTNKSLKEWGPEDEVVKTTESIRRAKRQRNKNRK